MSPVVCLGVYGLTMNAGVKVAIAIFGKGLCSGARQCRLARTRSRRPSVVPFSASRGSGSAVLAEGGGRLFLETRVPVSCAARPAFGGRMEALCQCRSMCLLGLSAERRTEGPVIQSCRSCRAARFSPLACCGARSGAAPSNRTGSFGLFEDGVGGGDEKGSESVLFGHRNALANAPAVRVSRSWQPVQFELRRRCEVLLWGEASELVRQSLTDVDIAAIPPADVSEFTC